MTHQPTAASSSPPAPAPTSPLFRAVRAVRKLDAKTMIRTHPYIIYTSLCFSLVAWANHAQYKRLKPLYPDFDQYREKEGSRMAEAKRQELADVLRYNNMVSSMRRDIGK
jgi:hypothetical protein